MKGKIVLFPVSLVLTLLATIMALALFFLFIAGVLVGLVKEMFKYYSWALLTGFKISRTINSNSLEGEARKIFKLPLSENTRGGGVIYAPDK
jgi:hypothetical protein